MITHCLEISGIKNQNIYICTIKLNLKKLGQIIYSGYDSLSFLKAERTSSIFISPWLRE